jgi:hypothetical protein
MYLITLSLIIVSAVGFPQKTQELFKILTGSIIDQSTVSSWNIPAESMKQREREANHSCHLKLLGALYTHYEETTEFQNFGAGMAIVSSLHGSSNSFSCLYMSNINSKIRKKWKPQVRYDENGVLGLVLECSLPQTTVGDLVCSSLRSQQTEILVSIFSSSLTSALNASYLLRPVRPATPLQIPLSSEFLPIFRSLPPNTHTTLRREQPAVLTVQTFSNPLSGPSLYMFVLYYLNLGYGVIIYDIYGLHQSFLQQFIDEEVIDYHPFTVFETLFPKQFNLEQYQRNHVSPSSPTSLPPSLLTLLPSLPFPCPPVPSAIKKQVPVLAFHE